MVPCLSTRVTRRFNVAVTRGMAMCVVVGQPLLLYADLHWRELHKYCVPNGDYIVALMLLLFVETA